MVVLLNLFLLLGLYTLLQPRPGGAVPVAPVRTEAAGGCLGYTARLLLAREGPDSGGRGSWDLDSAVWSLEIEAPVGLEQATRGTASTYAYASRNSTGEYTQHDLGQLQWAGSGQRLAQGGRVAVEPLPGGFAD